MAQRHPFRRFASNGMLEAFPGNHRMAIDTPAKIAIIGAGPIGLEATLYARFLGYDVELLESAATPCANVLRWGGTNMFTPFSLNRSSLGLAALRAQDEHYTPPEDDALLTHAEWFAAYLQPLAQSDLILDSLQLGTEVLEVGKVELHKADRPRGEYDRGSWDFRLRIRTLGGDRFLTADILLDCSGVVPQAVGHGGLRARRL